MFHRSVSRTAESGLTGLLCFLKLKYGVLITFDQDRSVSYEWSLDGQGKRCDRLQQTSHPTIHIQTNETQHVAITDETKRGTRTCGRVICSSVSKFLNFLLFLFCYSFSYFFFLLIMFLNALAWAKNVSWARPCLSVCLSVCLPVAFFLGGRHSAWRGRGFLRNNGNLFF
jgi:hypothetical protein